MFFLDNITSMEFKDNRILEVSSKYVNGSIRPLIEKFLSLKELIGIDLEAGKYVDLIFSAENVLEPKFRKNLKQILR